MAAPVYSVSQINGYIKRMFEQDFALQNIQIRGEVSNCKYHSAGHIYFTLKDAGAAIACVMFRGNRKPGDPKLTEGLQVILTGRVSVFERDGRYQLYVTAIRTEGNLGDLYRIYLERKQEYEEMGMFAPEYKKPIPRYAKTVGVVTASTGAAIHDIMSVTERRNPYVQLVLCPAKVQGDMAAESIARAIRALDRLHLDVLIVGRGGGSIEDLWAFNEPPVAEAIFAAETPIISAVGHEVDFTIADFVADLRAPTPSAAAELAVFDFAAFAEELAAEQSALSLAMDMRLRRLKDQTEACRLRLKAGHPRALLEKSAARNDALAQQLNTLMHRLVLVKRHELELAAAALSSVSPLTRLTGGYVYLTDENGTSIETAETLSAGDHVSLHMKDGIADACITDVHMRSLKFPEEPTA